VGFLPHRLQVPASQLNLSISSGWLVMPACASTFESTGSTTLFFAVFNAQLCMPHRVVQRES
jgi:hypothetical protein